MSLKWKQKREGTSGMGGARQKKKAGHQKVGATKESKPQWVKGENDRKYPWGEIGPQGREEFGSEKSCVRSRQTARQARFEGGIVLCTGNVARCQKS